ncbi:hypothetical protein [Burkholderia sp. S-53]|uniref:hypothetical protein n=1 Tax=Burkholderia sp. S-53 TaxID=2906514 RepID=UPI0021CF5D0D|nr:hypothetical protein [Burkholderia sp. S-53]UXU85567.1 hypothetical protein LXM88_04170 [Burkholderia sp. S-53]
MSIAGSGPVACAPLCGHAEAAAPSSSSVGTRESGSASLSDRILFSMGVSRKIDRAQADQFIHQERPINNE